MTCDFASLLGLDIGLRLLRYSKMTYGHFVFNSHQSIGRTCDLLFLQLGGSRHYVKKDGSEFELNRGELIYIPTGECYTSQVLDGESNGIFFDFKLFYGDEQLIVNEPFRIFKGEKLERRFHAALENPGDRLRAKSELYRLLSYLSREAQTASLNEQQLKIRECVLEIERHPELNRSIAELAHDACMSRTAFNVHFRDYTGMSPVEYRNRVRCERAAELLKSGEFSRTQIAEMLGFFDHSHLWRTMKKQQKNELPEQSPKSF